MQYRLFIAISAVTCLINGGFAAAEEVSTGATQTNITTGTTENPGASMDDMPVKPRVRDSGNVEWRRSGHDAPNPSRSAGDARSGGSDSSGGGNDGGGGGGGGGNVD